MSIRSLRARWTQRRMELAVQQIRNRSPRVEELRTDVTQPGLHQTRAPFGTLHGMTKTTSHTEWKGD